MSQLFEELGRKRRLFPPTRQIGPVGSEGGRQPLWTHPSPPLPHTQVPTCAHTSRRPLALFSRMVTSTGTIISTHSHACRAGTHTGNPNIQLPTREHPASARNPSMGFSCPRSLRAEHGAWKPLPTSELLFSLLGPLSCCLLTHQRGSVTVDGMTGLHMSSEPCKVKVASSVWEAVETTGYLT